MCKEKIAEATTLLEERMTRLEEAVLLKIAVQMTLVIMAFRTTFSMKGGHRIINSYFKTLPSEVSRNIHVVTIKYMEQECTCQNHVYSVTSSLLS